MMMRMKDRYEPLAENQYYIDKTGAFEKGIAGFPSIYMEGAAASGKTTAVRMLLERHREVTPIVFRMREELKAPETFEEKLKQFMSDSDSRIAGCRQYEHKTKSRRR